MTQGRAFPVDTKAAVVAAILAGASVSDAARRFRVNKATVSRWAAANATLATVRHQDRDPERIVDLLYELVAEHIVTMRAQLGFMAERGYLQDQPIAGISEMYEVEGGVLLRLLAGMSPIGATRQQEDP